MVNICWACSSEGKDLHMPYAVTTTPIEGVLVLEPQVFGDTRGFFFESFNARDFAQATGLQREFVQRD